MNRIAAQIYKYTARARLVHSIPGRMRVHLPWIKTLSNSRYLQYEVFLVEKLKEISGINNISCCFITGNVLIEYSVSLLDEKDLLRWFDLIKETLIDYFVNNPGYLETIDDERRIISELTDFIKRKIEKTGR